MPYVDVDKLIAYFQGEWNWHDCECVRQFAEDGEFERVIHAHWIYLFSTDKCSKMEIITAFLTSPFPVPDNS